jgi:hypothetical protein
MKKNSIVEKYRNVGQKVPSREVLERFTKANPLVKRFKPCYQSPRQIADKSWLCPTCKKTWGLLRSKGKIIVVQGYEQCADCHADICSAGEVKAREIRRKVINRVAKMYAGRRVQD